MQLSTHTTTLELKSLDAKSGRVSGYATRWGEVDQHRETVERGAFARSLADTKSKGRRLPILWQHKSAEPIGQWDELREDDEGLYVDGHLWVDEAPNARLALKGMAARCVTGLSIGYFVEEDRIDPVRRVRALKRVDLREVSVVTDPALTSARVDLVKQKLAAGELITESEFGRVLRERGFSDADADAIATVGFKSWASKARPANPSGLGDLVKALGSGLSLPTL